MVDLIPDEPEDRIIAPDGDPARPTGDAFGPHVENESFARSGTIASGVEGFGNAGLTESLAPEDSESMEHVAESGHDDSAMTD